MHPWLTLDKVFGAEAAVTLSWWLLKQVHAQLVKDYLNIQHYYLDRTDVEPVEVDIGASADETLLYVSLARASDGQQPAQEADLVETPAALAEDVSTGTVRLPQLRRRYFFKLLEYCGVEIAQGKGSEIKLLRKAKRPFRLGDHYGNNPTIPAFLAANILKRLEITSEEWIEAIAAQ
ncbi:hypothetical protein [Massilia haematophila]|uniref:Uncharacterized protein n=1 Tax=Massilia haematophila TaxID=457923 RepID=A0ABV7PKP1_9BURK